MSDIDAFLAGHVLDVLQDSAKRLAEEGLVIVAGVGCHLAEKLFLRVSPFRELRAFVALRCHATDAEMRIPGLLSYLELVTVHIAGVVDDELGGTGGSAARLIHQEYGIPLLQEYIRPSLATVRRSLPAGARLSVTVQEDHRSLTSNGRNLIEGIGMVHMCSSSLTLRVHPVLSGVVFAGDGGGHPSAG